MATKQLFIDDLRAYAPTLKIHAKGPEDSISQELIFTGNLNTTLSNNFGDLFDGEAAERGQQFLDKVGQQATEVASHMGVGDEVSSLATGASNFLNLRNSRNTISRWSGSGKPTFSFPVMIVRARKEDNVVKTVLDLQKGVLPRRGETLTQQATGASDSSLQDFALKPPLGYDMG